MNNLKKQSILVLGLCLAVGLLCACRSQSQMPGDPVAQFTPSATKNANEQAEPIAGTSWRLVSMPGFPDLGAVEVTLEFDHEGAINGVGGCNLYGGSYQTTAGTNHVRFGELFSTLMACLDDNSMDIEFAYLGALSEALTYSISLDALRIQVPGGTLEFIRANDGLD